MFYAVTGLLGASRVIYTAGTKTWTKPAGVTWAILGIIGGGGNGGRGDHITASNGGGGGGGAVVNTTVYAGGSGGTGLAVLVYG